MTWHMTTCCRLIKHKQFKNVNVDTLNKRWLKACSWYTPISMSKKVIPRAGYLLHHCHVPLVIWRWLPAIVNSSRKFALAICFEWSKTNSKQNFVLIWFCWKLCHNGSFSDFAWGILRPLRPKFKLLSSDEATKGHLKTPKHNPVSIKCSMLCYRFTLNGNLF